MRAVEDTASFIGSATPLGKFFQHSLATVVSVAALELWLAGCTPALKAPPPAPAPAEIEQLPPRPKPAAARPQTLVLSGQWATTTVACGAATALDASNLTVVLETKAGAVALAVQAPSLAGSVTLAFQGQSGAWNVTGRAVADRMTWNAPNDASALGRILSLFDGGDLTLSAPRRRILIHVPRAGDAQQAWFACAQRQGNGD